MSRPKGSAKGDAFYLLCAAAWQRTHAGTSDTTAVREIARRFWNPTIATSRESFERRLHDKRRKAGNLAAYAELHSNYVITCNNDGFTVAISGVETLEEYATSLLQAARRARKNSDG
jgi:hypothetical protein